MAAAAMVHTIRGMPHALPGPARPPAVCQQQSGTPCHHLHALSSSKAHPQNSSVMPSSSASGGCAAALPGTALAQLMQRRAPSGRNGCW